MSVLPSGPPGGWPGVRDDPAPSSELSSLREFDEEEEDEEAPDDILQETMELWNKLRNRRKNVGTPYSIMSFMKRFVEDASRSRCLAEVLGEEDVQGALENQGVYITFSNKRPVALQAVWS